LFSFQLTNPAFVDENEKLRVTLFQDLTT